jgi:hypothetical protein
LVGTGNSGAGFETGGRILDAGFTRYRLKLSDEAVLSWPRETCVQANLSERVEVARTKVSFCAGFQRFAPILFIWRCIQPAECAHRVREDIR